MRKLIAIAIALGASCAVTVFVPHTVSRPAGGGWENLTDAVCEEVVSSRPADVVLEPELRTQGPEPPTVTYRDLPLHQREIVRFAGYLVLAPFGAGTGIYPSFEVARLDLGVENAPDRTTVLPSPHPRRLRAHLDPVFFDDPVWRLRGSILGGRCARVEGRFGTWNLDRHDSYAGDLTDVRRVEVWVRPFRPVFRAERSQTGLPPLPPRISEQLGRTVSQ